MKSSIISHKKVDSPQIPEKEFTLDTRQRRLHDLRLSVIDRCNLRCPYCMPEENLSKQYTFLKKQRWLTFEEIHRLVQIFARLGVAKIRITGGEPLLRPNLPTLIKQLANIDGIEDIAMTTNGILLPKYATALKDAGLKRLTISLDTLDAKTFRQMCGHKAELTEALQGIAAAQKAGFAPIKINVVVQKGINDNDVLDIIRYFRHKPFIVRFIEYMDVGNQNQWRPEQVVPSAKIISLINQHYPVEPIEPNYHGEVAERYRFKDGGGEIGFISSVSQPFCGSCTRARLSTDGILYTCLFASEGYDLKAFLREGVDEDAILKTIRRIWQKRDDNYSEERFATETSFQNKRKVEMYQVGG